VRNSLVVFFFFCVVFAHLPSRAQRLPGASAPADTGLRRYELGFNTDDIRTFCVGEKNCYLPAFSVGAGATLNWNQRFAFDANLNVTTGTGNGATNIAGGRTVEVLAGLRGEIRARHYGYFLKAQPGLLYWDNVITNVVRSTPSTFSFVYSGRTRFVSDVGGGMEYSPTPRIHLRGEFADLVMRYSSTNWLNNLQPSAGVYVSLGRPIDWNPPVYNAAAVHPFFDAANIVLLTVSVLGMSADAITTQRGLARGRGEADPIARPLVKYGWSGQISLEGLETGAEIAGMYGLHRTGHHWVERTVPVCLAVAHAVAAYQNARTGYGR
jgi:hypothetical protein